MAEGAGSRFRYCVWSAGRNRTEAAVSLSIVFDEETTVLATERSNATGVGAPAIEVNKHEGTSPRRDDRFNEAVIYLERVKTGFYKNGDKAVLSDGKDGGNKGIGRDDDLIAFVQQSHLDVGP